MRRGHSTYRFFGANVWYLPNLGAPKTGDKARLDRELDQLARLGVTNVRIMAATEGPDELPPSRPNVDSCLDWCDEHKGHCNIAKHASQGRRPSCECVGCPFCSAQRASLGEPRLAELCPDSHSQTGQGQSAHMVPSMQPGPGERNEDVLRGMDYALHALSKRKMTAVLCLNNMWQWSGGFAAYVEWATGEQRPFMSVGAKDADWQRHQNFAIRFYELPEAQRLWRAYVRAIVLRPNSANDGRLYRDDPTILAWQLANEPRALSKRGAYRAWVGDAAGFLKGLDCNHMVTVGSEGPTPWPSYVNNDLRQDHGSEHIDYVTIHVWPQNWGWFDPAASKGSAKDLEHAWKASVAYIDAAVAVAASLAKPLVVEEFGLARDNGRSTGGSTSQRDAFYTKMCSYLAAKPGTVAGLNFWAWAGEGRPRDMAAERVIWAPGDAWTGDPPHEPQGWYSVYAEDATTHAVFAQCMSSFSLHDQG